VNVALAYGHVYRARVEIQPVLREVVTAELLSSTLKQYQLFGRAEPTGFGYSIVAEFRGKSGTYALPEQVTAVDLVR